MGSLRKSNTEPIIRIYAESEGEDKANALAENMINEIKSIDLMKRVYLDNAVNNTNGARNYRVDE